MASGNLPNATPRFPHLCNSVNRVFGKIQRDNHGRHLAQWLVRSKPSINVSYSLSHFFWYRGRYGTYYLYIKEKTRAERNHAGCKGWQSYWSHQSQDLHLSYTCPTPQCPSNSTGEDKTHYHGQQRKRGGQLKEKWLFLLAESFSALTDIWSATYQQSLTQT